MGPGVSGWAWLGVGGRGQGVGVASGGAWPGVTNIPWNAVARRPLQLSVRPPPQI